MAKLTLQITGNVDDVKRKIQIVRDELSSIEKHPIKIGVQASGLDAIAARLKEISDTEIKAAEAAAKLANAEASKMRAQVKAAEAGVAVANAEKQAAQATEQAAKSADHLAISGKQLVQMFLDSAKQTDYAKSKGNELFSAYQKLQIVSQSVAAAQTQIGSSMALVIRNAGTLQAQIRSLANVYNQLATAQGGGGGGLTTGGATGGGLTAQNNAIVTTPGREIVWSRYGDWRDSVIEGQWRPVTEGAQAAATAVNTAAAAAGNASSSFNTMREGMATAWAKMKEGTPIADALGDSIGNIIVKITTWQVVNGIVANIKRAFKDALDTMREVDQQLTNIQKVSDLTADDIARIGDSAYETASKYGVAADEYLSAVYTFQKAGLGDSAEKMGELAIKTMLVGDTTADVATKFIIASNAAWKYGGSVEELSRLVDEADKLNNTYAVSLQDIAEGLPIVAATAAQAGMTAEQTMSAISTIVASTGQSATKAATALRAIIMNLIGETGELDDGLSVTEESVASLNAVLNKYARSSMEAAEAQGKILDPMEAVAALAKAAEDGFLNEAQLFDVLSGLGGKLRTTQLTALVNAQEMYNSMLKDTADAAGTADREISIMLESWNSKTQILTNSFTQFVSHLLNSNGIKAGIDILTNFVKLLDSGVGKVVEMTVAFLAMGKIIAQIGKSNIFNFLLNEIMGLVAGTVSATTALADLWALLSTSPLFWAAAAAAVLYGLVQLTDALNDSYVKQNETLKELQKQYDELYGDGSEYDDLLSRVGELTDKEIERLGVLRAEADELKRQLDYQKEVTFEAWRKTQTRIDTNATQNGSQYSFRFVDVDVTKETLDAATAALTALDAEMEAGQHSQAGYIAGLEGIVNGLKESAIAIQNGKDAGVELTETEQAILTLYTDLSTIIGNYTAGEKAKNDAISEGADATNKAAKANEALQKAFEEVDKKGSLTYGTLKELDAIYPGLSAKILDVNGNLTAEGAAAMSSRAALYELISSMITANTTALNFDAQIAALQQLATEAGVAAGAISAVFAAANMGAAGTGDWDEIANMTPDQVARYRASSASNSMLALIRNQIKDQEYVGGGGGGGGGGGSKEEDPAEAELNRLKAVVELRKQELNLLKESGAEQSSIEAKQREIQDAIHAQAEFLRSTEEYQITLMQAQEDSSKLTSEQVKLLNEVKSLSTEWWKIENDIIDAQEKIAKQLREDISDAIADIGDALENASDAMVDPLQAQLDALTAAHDATEARREEEEKIAAIQEKQIELEKARIALENAQRERTVRQYNSRTGQWEWVANAKNIEAAQENLENAQKALIDAQTDLAKYYADQAYEAQKAVLEKQIKATKEAFSSFRNTIKEASEAVKDGEMDIDEAYDYISGEMKRIYDEYGVDLTDTLFDVVSGFDNVSGAIAELYIKILQMLSETDSANEKFKNDKGGSKKSEQFIGAMSNIYANARERGDADTMAAANRAANEERGVGSVITAVADVALISAQSSGKSIADYSADYMAARAAGDYSAMEVANRAANILRGNGNVVTAGEDINKVRTSGGYDYGGILTGKGGIKATQHDEMVLPPEMTRTLLDAERSGSFDALLQHLGIVTSAANEFAGFGGAVSKNTIGEQHNGDIISINGIELRSVTENTTLGELTRMAKNLALVKGS